MKERKKVTYLLGAGASANALPVVSEMNLRMFIFISYFKNLFKEDSDSFSVYFDENLIKSTINEYYKTLDNYAKYLYISNLNNNARNHLDNTINTPDYIFFKLLIACYFNFEQFYSKTLQNDNSSFSIISKAISEYYEINRNYNNEYEEFIKKINKIGDERYNSFILQIFNDGFERLPENIKIVSWNYDSQIELCLETISKININNIEGFIKLNGSFVIKNIKENKSINFQEIFNNQLKIKDEFRKIFTKTNDYISDISFAWENKDSTKIITSQNYFKETDAIVIIGYSFPNFNRVIDIELFSKVDLEKTKIYVQDMNADNIIKKLSGVKRGMEKVAEPYTKISEFLIPNEFWEEKEV